MWSNEIPFEDLPRTFQDAVVTTNRLGFEYLWIDALCIVQDCKDDWYQEASAMSDVYTNSSCNLSALDAQDDSDGMFSSRDPEENIPILTAFSNEKQPDRLFYIESEHDLDEQITRKPLNRRGWVVQERLLAPRILHFGKTQLFWECAELHASESFPSGVSHLNSWPNLTARLQSYEQGGKDDDEKPKASKLRFGWQKFIAMYSASDLSVSADKLVAISGVAKVFGTVFRDEYCAGLWKSDFNQHLAWRIVDAEGVRPSSYRAPSWSWASVDGQVEYTSFSRGWQDLAFAESVEVTTVTDDAFGAVKDAALRLRGQLYLGVRGNDENYRYLASEVTRAVCIPDVRVVNQIFPDSLHDPISSNLCSMPIRVSSHPYLPLKFESLIIKPSDRDGMYERWGLLETTCYNNEDSSPTETPPSGYQPCQEYNIERYPEQIIAVV